MKTKRPSYTNQIYRVDFDLSQTEDLYQLHVIKYELEPHSSKSFHAKSVALDWEEHKAGKPSIRPFFSFPGHDYALLEALQDAFSRRRVEQRRVTREEESENEILKKYIGVLEKQVLYLESTLKTLQRG